MRTPKSEKRSTPETLEQEKFISDYVDCDRLSSVSIVSELFLKLKEVSVMIPDKDRIRGSLIRCQQSLV